MLEKSLTVVLMNEDWEANGEHPTSPSGVRTCSIPEWASNVPSSTWKPQAVQNTDKPEEWGVSTDLVCEDGTHIWEVPGNVPKALALTIPLLKFFPRNHWKNVQSNATTALLS